MQVHWVRCGRQVVHHKSNRGVASRIIYVPFGVVRVGGVSGVSEEEDGSVIVGAEGDIVHRPNEVVGVILGNIECEVYCCGGIWSRSEGFKGSGGLKRVLLYAC